MFFGKHIFYVSEEHQSTSIGPGRQGTLEILVVFEFLASVFPFGTCESSQY
jgi:hypothetical protein